MAEQRFLTPIKVGLLASVIAYFVFTFHGMFTLSWIGEWDRMGGGSFGTMILIEDISATIGLIFRFAGSIIALVAIVLYFTKKSLSSSTGYKVVKTVLVFDTPKSESSKRSIPLPTFLLENITQFSQKPNCFLLSGDPEQFIKPRTFQNHFKAMLNQAGVRDINFHALRHTFATNCINLGFDVKALSEILGHADVSVTLNTYVHPSITILRSYMERLGEMSV
jgi:hypothetical protein